MRQSDMKDQPIDRQTRPAQGFAQACDEILIVQLPAFFAGEPVNDIDERSRAYDRLQFCHWILCSVGPGTPPPTGACDMCAISSNGLTKPMAESTRPSRL